MIISFSLAVPYKLLKILIKYKRKENTSNTIRWRLRWIIGHPAQHFLLKCAGIHTALSHIDGMFCLFNTKM